MFNDTELLYKLKQPIFLNCPSIADLKELRDRKVTIAFGREFQVLTTLFTKKLSLTVAQKQKLFLIRELNDSLRKFRLFLRTFAAGPDLSMFFLRFSGFT